MYAFCTAIKNAILKALSDICQLWMPTMLLGARNHPLLQVHLPIKSIDPSDGFRIVHFAKVSLCR